MYITNDRSDLILSIIDKNKNIQNVVDLGCNDGATLNGLKNDKSFNAKFYYGVDYSPHILKKKIEGISFLNCDLNGNLSPIKDILYKSRLILLLDVLEHLYHPELFLKKLNKNRDKTIFEDLTYTVFALGDSSFNGNKKHAQNYLQHFIIRIYYSN